VNVPKARKRPANHLVDETARPVELDDPRGETLPDAEVHGVPGDFVAEIEEPGRPSPDGALAGGRGRFHVRLDVAREIEAQLDRSVDAGLEDERRHASYDSAVDAYLPDALREFRKYRKMADAAVAQVPEAKRFARLDPETNSLAVLMKHMAGNMRSRWTDFLTSDGEKPDRNRDGEFEEETDTPASIRERWEKGWACLFGAIEPLTDADLSRTITIRGEPHTVLQALQRQLTHYAYHVGQIVFLAKHLAGPEWKSLSIPRGKSKEFEVAKDGSRYLPK
jgi:hypothetical protein